VPEFVLSGKERDDLAGIRILPRNRLKTIGRQGIFDLFPPKNVWLYEFSRPVAVIQNPKTPQRGYIEEDAFPDFGHFGRSLLVVLEDFPCLPCLGATGSASAFIASTHSLAEPVAPET
jgi:hypothetical protein